jgi:amino acid transporter
VSQQDVVDAVYLVSACVFLMFIFVGAASVATRVAFYRAKGYRRPRLLTRDVIDRAGFATSFGLILFGRAFDVPGRTELPWTLATSIPAIVAAGTFVYYELFVIERGRRPPERTHSSQPRTAESEEEQVQRTISNMEGPFDAG